MKLLRFFFALPLAFFLCTGTLHAQSATAPSGSGTLGSPYQIATLNNLYWIATQVNSGTNEFSGSYFEQSANIDASGTSTWFSGAGWIPIGNENYYFRGIYNGQNHTISNVHINVASAVDNYYVGLFGLIWGGTVKNLGVTNVSMTGSMTQYFGGLAGYLLGAGTVENCHVTGSISGKSTCAGLIGKNDGEMDGINTVNNCHASCTIIVNTTVAGGLIGESLYGAVTNCYTTGSVSGVVVAGYIGGLIGFNSNSDLGSTVTNCYSTAAVEGRNQVGGLLGTNSEAVSNCFATGSVTDIYHDQSYGGLIGCNTGPVSDCYATGSINSSAYSSGGFIGLNMVTAVVSRCYASGSLSGQGVEFGGFVGDNRGVVSDCYATGSASSTAYNYITGIKIGGFVGINSGTMTCCYATGLAASTGIAPKYVGGFAGVNSGTGNIAANCFWNSTVLATGCGGNSGIFSSAGKTTSEMQTVIPYNTASWSPSYWSIVDGNYPALTAFLKAAILTTQAVSSIGTITATGNGNITDLGYPNPSAHGICWNTAAAPTISNSKIDNGAKTSSGAFTGSMTGLSAGTKYYVRAYATANAVTSYGEEVNFTTMPIAPTTQASAITLGSNAAGTTLLVNWTNGNGANRAVFMKELAGAITAPSDGATYAASASWSSKGNQLGTSGYYCVYNGPGNSVSVTGTAPNTYYVVQAFEYNGTGSSSLFNTSTVAANPSNVTSLPVELTSFTTTVANYIATLSWQTATEINNYGFDVERKRIADGQSPVSDWMKVGFIVGNGTSNTTHHYSYSDAPGSSGTYAYRLKQIDRDGAYIYSSETEVTISIPKVFSLNQNYPNPFNPATTLSFMLAQDGFTMLKIYTVLGKEVATLVNGEMKAGVLHTVTFDASTLSSGVYFSRLESCGKAQIQRLVLMR